MSKKMRKLTTICAVAVLIVAVSDTVLADWEETFGGNTFDQTWTFGCFPDVTKTFSATIKDGPDDDDYLGGSDPYLAFDPGTVLFDFDFSTTGIPPRGPNPTPHPTIPRATSGPTSTAR